MITTYMYFKTKTDFTNIRKLSDEESETLENALVFMNKLNIKLFFFRMVDLDYAELKKFETGYENQINHYPLSIDENTIFFEFTRLLSNYLSSINLFLNQYCSNVKRDYESELYAEFNELRKDLHANHLSYRIIYELQNEFRHSKIPSVTIQAKRKEFSSPLEAKFYINKDCLKNIRKLKNDEEFKALDELIDINEHMENMNSYLFELASKILKFELDLHLEHYDFLKSLLDEIGIEGRPCVMKYNEFNETTVRPSINFIDKRFIELIDKIKVYFK